VIFGVKRWDFLRGGIIYGISVTEGIFVQLQLLPKLLDLQHHHHGSAMPIIDLIDDDTSPLN
jgi:hypothetical protein